jgi:malyl-CoA/(S)-citramalyl-CoA lyase
MKPARVQRSELAVPATSDHFFEKAARSSADSVFLDLEDAVTPTRKEEAREIAIAALNDVDWGSQTVGVRINGLDTQWGLRDLMEVVPRSPRLDLIVVPKVGTTFDVQFVDAVLGSLERETRRQTPIGIEVLIETPLGLANVEQIAASSARLESMIFGIGDYSIAMRTFDLNIGAPHPWYAVPVTDEGATGSESVRHWNDQWHFALARIANACRAYGLRPIDGPYANYADLDGFRASAERAVVLGFEGKWAIYPTQVPLANEVFTPLEAQANWARQLLQDLDGSVADGRGAFGRDGKLLDMAHEKLARALLERVDAIERRESSARDDAREVPADVDS